MKKNKRLKLREIIISHVYNNRKEYILITLIFFIGLFAGVMFVNNMAETQSKEVCTFFNEFINKFKNIENINNINLLKTSIAQNIVLTVILWFFGTTVIRYSYCIWNNTL